MNNVDQYILENTVQHPSSATITITDNDTAPNVWIDAVQNGAEGGTNGYFRLKRDNTQNALTVYFTLSGTATRGLDYSIIANSVTFAVGQDTIEIPINVIDDQVVEGTETVILTLTPNKVNNVDQYILENTLQHEARFCKF